jgi:zinc transport system permease protein
MADAGPAPAPDDDLADLEAALAADQAPPEAAPIETPDHAPTWDEFTDGWDLFRDPILAGGVAGLVLGFLSVYIVLRRMVFVSASVTQAAGFGVAASFYLGARMGWAFDPSWGATAVALVAASLVAPDPRRLGLSREMVLGLTFAMFSGLTILISARMPQEAHDVQAILFGTAVAVSPGDLDRLAVAALGVLALHAWWFRGFTFASFDPQAARVQGLPVRLIDLALVLTIGVAVGESARTLGALPAFALSTLPGIAALQLARGPLWVPFVTAAVLGAAAGAGGYVVAFFYELPVGATQTACAGAAVVAALGLRGAATLAGRLRRT